MNVRLKDVQSLGAIYAKGLCSFFLVLMLMLISLVLCLSHKCEPGLKVQCSFRNLTKHTGTILLGSWRVYSLQFLDLDLKPTTNENCNRLKRFSKKCLSLLKAIVEKKANKHPNCGTEWGQLTTGKLMAKKFTDN